DGPGMQARSLRIGIGVALLLVGYMMGMHTSTSIHAEMKVTVPTGYGKVVAGDSSSLWFEDSAGTLRQVNIPAGNTIFTITRQR
ncbi:MAG: hypothetical protein WA354_19395, partial [Terracidiphilus sp.]